MTVDATTAYGLLAERDATTTEKAGRYAEQALAERGIVPDLLAKLVPKPTDRLLEIGCGPGGLLIPLSFHVAEAVGIDEARVIGGARARFQDARVTWIAGRFPDVAVPGRFDLVLVYSVLHCLPDLDAVDRFVDAAAGLLAPGGRLLLGDLPASDTKARFLSSEAGRAFDAAWRAERARSGGAARSPLDGAFADVEMIGGFSDADMLRLVGRLRAGGCHAYLLRQPAELPFGRTREDILVVRP